LKRLVLLLVALLAVSTPAHASAGHGFGVGRLTGVNDALGTWSPSYDERGNLLTESRVMGGVTLNTAYSYDAASRISGITYPSGWIAKYARNAQGEVTGVTAQANATATPASIVGNIAYLGLGEADTGLTFGNGVAEARGYDLDLRPTTLTDTGTAGALVQSLTYGYDYADNVKAVTDMVNGANTQAMTYDTLNRIKTASGGYGAYAWTYDNVGNRLTEQLGSNPASQYTYTPGTSQFATYAAGGVTQTYSYTKSGNIAGSTSSPAGTPTGFTYNQADRLATASIPNAVGETLAYDWRGQMLTRTLAGDPPTVEQFQYGPANHLLEEDTGGVAQADYVYLGDRPVAAIAPASGTISYLHDDRLDTPQKATASNQTVAWAAVLNPFGVGAASGSIQQDLRMTGMFADANTGILHNGFRDLVPGFGRYLETDPIGLSGGMNTYGYVGQNPLGYVDPWGTTPWGKKWGGYIGGALGSGAGAIAGTPEAPIVGTAVGAGVGYIEGTHAGSVLGDDITNGLQVAGIWLSQIEAAGLIDLQSQYSQAAAQYPKKACMPDENHHIVPKYLGGTNNGPTVTIPAPYHQLITNAFRNEWAYGQMPPNPGRLGLIINKVYDIYPLPIE
jgi:RHS repeat-associated protein